MHVLIIPSWYPRFPGDLEGTFFRDQALALADIGINVGVLFPDLKGVARYFTNYRRPGIKIGEDGPLNEVRSFGFNWFPRLMSGFEWLWKIHGLKAADCYFEKFGRPDIIHAHSMLPAGSLAVNLQKRFDIPFVLTEHSTVLLNNRIASGLAQKCRNIASLSSANLAVSEPAAAALERRYGGNWAYLPNIVSPFFLSHPLITPPAASTFHIISAAILRPRKRMDVIIDAVHLLRQRNSDVSLTIIGDGEQRGALERQVAHLKLGKFVHFAGEVAPNDMPERMARGHVLVSASDFETFGVTLIEGLALGMPVVATRSGGPESIVTPAVGRLVNKGDAGALADAIQHIMKSLAQFAPEKIRQYCQENYSPPVISEALANIYRSIVAGNAK